MKNIVTSFRRRGMVFFCAIALAAVGGLTFVSCDDGSTDPDPDQNTNPPPGGSTTFDIATAENLTTAVAAIVAAGSGTEESPKEYTLDFTADVTGTIELPLDVEYVPLKDIIVTLKGTGKKLTLPATEELYPPPLLSVNSGKKVIIDGLTLDGGTSTGYNNDLVAVTAGGTLELKSGAITNFKGGSSNNAVSISGGGTFTMSDGTIINNKSTSSSRPGAVYVGSSSTFTMTGGEIKDNKNAEATPQTNGYGGGVYVFYTGTFIMSGGTISGNQSLNYVNAAANRHGKWLRTAPLTILHNV